MRLILVALLVWAGGAAQTAKPRPPSAWPVETVQIEGLKEYKRELVLKYLGIEIGRPASEKELQSARDRLLATGAFDSVGMRYQPAPDGKGYAVTFEVVEAGPRFPVRFEDLPVPSADLTAVLRRSDPFFSDTIPATAPLLARYAKAVQEYTAAHGFSGKVSGKVEPDDAGRLAVVFRPAASRPAVARVRFNGNAVVPSTALENAINGVAIGLPYTEARFRQLLDTQIRPLYDARGRVRVAFPEIATEPDKDVKGLLVTVKVDEGASYSLGGVEVVGTGLNSAELHKVAALKPGGVFNRETIEAGVSRIESRMRRDGYMHVTSAVDRHIDDKAKRVDLTIRVEPGPRYTFGNLTIQGLDLLTEPAIRKMWSIQEGQPFNSAYPDYFLSQVKEGGVLDNLGETKSVVKTNEDTRTVDVTLVFKGEAPKPKKKDRNEETRPTELPGPF